MVPPRLFSLAIAIIMVGGCRHVPESTRDLGELAVPVQYVGQVAVIVTRDGVAAVQFTERVPEGCKYTYRYLPAGTRGEQRGAGVVFEKYEQGPTHITSDGIHTHELTDRGSQTSIAAGGITVNWSKAGTNARYVYFTPEKERVYLVDTFYYNEVDLHRFAK